MAPEKREYDQRWNGIWEAGLNEGEVRCNRTHRNSCAAGTVSELC